MSAPRTALGQDLLSVIAQVREDFGGLMRDAGIGDSTVVVRRIWNQLDTLEDGVRELVGAIRPLALDDTPSLAHRCMGVRALVLWGPQPVRRDAASTDGSPPAPAMPGAA